MAREFFPGTSGHHRHHGMRLVRVEIIRGFIFYQDIADFLPFRGTGMNELDVRATFRCTVEGVDNSKLVVQIGQLLFGKTALQARIERLDVIGNTVLLQTGKLFDTHLFANCREKANSLWRDRAAPNNSEMILSKFKQHAWKMGRKVKSPCPKMLCSTSFLMVAMASKLRFTPVDSGQSSLRRIWLSSRDLPSSANDFDPAPDIVLMHKVCPGDMSEHREHFSFKFQYRAVEDLYGNDHRLPGPDQPFVVKNAKPSAVIKRLFFQLVKLYGIVSSWGDFRILFNLGDSRAVDRAMRPMFTSA
jgi:hypothetical protein